MKLTYKLPQTLNVEVLEAKNVVLSGNVKP